MPFCNVTYTCPTIGNDRINDSIVSSVVTLSCPNCTIHLKIPFKDCKNEVAFGSSSGIVVSLGNIPLQKGTLPSLTVYTRHVFLAMYTQFLNASLTYFAG